MASSLPASSIIQGPSDPLRPLVARLSIKPHGQGPDIRRKGFFTSTTYDPILASLISSHHNKLVAEKGLWRAVTAVTECSKKESGP